MVRDPLSGLSRRAVAHVENASVRAGEDLLAAAPLAADLCTQRSIEAAIEAFADALRMVSAQAAYVRAAWPATGPAARNPALPVSAPASESG